MSGAADIDSNTGAKRRPDQAIYRPGMLRRGIDLTLTKPKAENQPPPSERKIRQMQDKERADRSHGPAAASAGFYNQRPQQRPPQPQRERNFSESYQNSNGTGGYPQRGRGGGGGGFRRDNFDSRSVRSNRQKQNFRPSRNRPPVDTMSEMGHNDDTRSIASTTFSTDTSIYGNGFASEMNSRQTSIQSLLGADLQNFDWAEALDDGGRMSCLENLPETDSTGHQEDELLSEKTPTGTPRKFSVNTESLHEELPDVDEEQKEKWNNEDVLVDDIKEITEKIEGLAARDDIEAPVLADLEENHVAPAVVELVEDVHVAEAPEIVLNNGIELPVLPQEEQIELPQSSIRIYVDQTFSALKNLDVKMQATFGQSSLPELSEHEMIEYLNEMATNFRQMIKNLSDSKDSFPTNNADEFKSCALDVMKVTKSAEKAAQIVTVRKNNYILSIVVEITMESLFIVSALLIYNLEQSKKYQLVESFEAIWSKLISKVKRQVTSYGKNLVMHLITFTRSIVSTVSEFIGADEYLGVFVKSVQTTDYKDFVQGFVVPHPQSGNKLLNCPDSLLNFASYVYRWQGDLVRYQAMILGSMDYDPCLNFYFLSFICDPSNGTSLNQMGAVASYKNSRRKNLARRRTFVRRISVIDEKQTASELLTAISLLSHTLTVSKPFLAAGAKLAALLSSNEGLEDDPNTQRVEFVQKFLAVANRAYSNVDEGMADAVTELTNSFRDICEAEMETTVFTTADIVNQIGIYWNLICLGKVGEDHKTLLKKILLFYMENLAGKLLAIDDVPGDADIERNLAFIAPPLAILTQIFPDIGGNAIPDPNSLDLTSIVSIVNRLATPDVPSMVALPEMLLSLNGYKNFSFNNSFYGSTTSDSTKAALSTRLSVILNFLQGFPTAA